MNFWHQSRQNISRISHYLAKPHILFYALPWLMILLVLGTIAQKEVGLYNATEKYFNSIILWLGPIPTPGGLTTIGVILVALAIKFIFFSTWQRKRAGIILTHLGVLLLLIGSIVTSTMSREGFMIIPEGQSINSMSDYRERVLTIHQDDTIIQEFSFKSLQENQIITVNNLTFKILLLCDNCDAKVPSGTYKNLQGLAANMELFSVPDEKNTEANFSGLIFEISGSKKAENGSYIVIEDIPKIPEITSDAGEIRVNLGRKKEKIPFSITLKNFKKIDYPGTVKAREFESDIIIQDGDLEWPATISMNKPLRYKGYTFYQSSFEQRENIEVTVFSVVQNIGQIFPYISTLIIFIGLLLHLIIRLQGNDRKRVKS